MSDLLNSASLVMIPSGYKEDTVFSAIPTDGSGDLSFTRASNGTRVNSAGLVEVCPWNFVEQSSNLGSWSNAGVTITTGITDAYGTTNAITMSNISSGSNTDYIVKYSNAMALPTGTQINYSVYLKGSGTIGVVIERSISGDYFYEQQGVTLSSTWTRYDFAYTIGVGVNANGISFYVTNLTGTTATSVDICFPQVNYGSTAKPYFPTTDRLNVPRLTYQNGGGGCPSLLLEKQSTNLLTYSEQFDNAGWNKIQISATANNTTSPDGTQNADLITTTATGVCYTYELIAGTNGAYSASVYAKNGNNNYLALNIQNSLNNWVTSVFDLSDGSLGEYAQGSGGGIVYVNHTITPVGNGWYRCVLNYTTNQNSYYCPMFAPLKTGNSFTSAYGEAQSNANNKTIYFWGAQLEASSYPTSYIPTTSSSATRVADACFKTGISSLIGGGVGTWFMDFEMVQGAGSGNPFAFDLSDGTVSNRLFLYWGESLQTWNWGGVDTAITLPSTLRKKVAIKYSSGTAKLFCNGSSISTLSINSAFSRLDIGQRFSNTFPMDGKINEAFFLTTSLTDAECQALTTI